MYFGIVYTLLSVWRSSKLKDPKYSSLLTQKRGICVVKMTYAAKLNEFFSLCAQNTLTFLFLVQAKFPGISQLRSYITKFFQTNKNKTRRIMFSKLR